LEKQLEVGPVIFAGEAAEQAMDQAGDALSYPRRENGPDNNAYHAAQGGPEHEEKVLGLVWCGRIHLWSRFALLKHHHRGSLSPESFNLVVFAQRSAQNMNNNILIIQHNPAAPRRAFDTRIEAKLVLYRLIDVFNDGLQLAFALPRTDNKIVGNRALMADIQQRYSMSLLIIRQFDRSSCKGCCLDDLTSRFCVYFFPLSYHM
jgi:hypothetical protein